ncbi:MAG: DNA primase [Syntrophales bacterium]|nr:DNA primase [Syntrophales bacterium]
MANPGGRTVVTVFSDETLQEVRQRADILEVISSYVTLKRAGRNYVGLCPFHHEKTPSFTVSPEKQIFYCFGCGTGGDVVSFLIKINNWSFPEAVRFLAERLGIPIKEKAAQKSKLQGLEPFYVIHKAAANLFADALFSPVGERARLYLKNRGLGEKTIRQFKLGYAPESWHWLQDKLKNLGQDLDLANKAGLLVAREKGGYYDRFRHRIIFPIFDLMDRVIAFGGRELEDGTPKYLNSPESPIYTKGHTLYGLNFAREEIRKKGHVIVVEGYFDLLSLWDRGIQNVVATLGTAFTEEHVSLLHRFTSQAVAIFDPDEAGKKALARSLSLFLKGNLEVKVVILPSGYDPDLYIRTFGREKWEEEVTHARPAVEYYVDEVLHPSRGIQQERLQIKEALGFISQISSPLERHLFIRRIAQRFNIDESFLERELKTSIPSPPNQEKKRASMDNTNDLLELKLIYLMLNENSFAHRVSKSNILDFFLHQDLKELADWIVDCSKRGESPNLTEAMVRLDENRRQRLLTWTMENNERDTEKEFFDTLKRIKEKWFERTSQNLNCQIREAQERGDDILCRKLLAEKAKLLKEEQSLRNLTVS